MSTLDIHLELDMASNMFGSLSQEVRDRLQAVVDNPTTETWDDAHCILLTMDMTLWQAVIAVDPTFPKRGRVNDDNSISFDRIPDSALLWRAMFYATH